MDYLRVRNWDKFQHYKDRTPPWIKLHRDLLNDYEFSCLQDASKAHLMLFWLLASQVENKIPNDLEWIEKRLGTNTKIDITLLIDKGFLVLEQDDSKPLATRYTETYKEEKYKEETDKKPRAKTAVEIPSFIDSALWAEFTQHRKEISKPLKPTSSKSLLAKLGKWHDEGIDVNECIANAITNGWQGIFKNERDRNSRKHSQRENPVQLRERQADEYRDSLASH